MLMMTMMRGNNYKTLLSIIMKLVWTTLLLSIITGVNALKDVAITIPQAVKIGDTVTLQCHYNLEGEPLYTVKWYKGLNEFFRYVPKEMPSTREFLLDGISIDLNKSTPNKVVLTNVQTEVTGRYRCEVSTDSPNFYTVHHEEFMYVINVPKGDPEMTIEKGSREVGYPLRGNCTSPLSYPPVNLTWYLNDRKVNATSTIHVLDTNYTTDTKRKPHITVSSLDIEIDGDTFQGGKARLKCVATLFNLYEAHVEHIADEERPRPRPSSVFGTRSSSPDSLHLKGFSLINVPLFFLFTIIIR